MNNITPDYSSLFYYNPLPSLVYDLEELKIHNVNQAALEHYGYSKEEFLSFTIKDIRPEEEIPKLAPLIEKIDEYEGNIFFGVFTHQKKSGELIRMEINGHKVDYLGKQCMMVICQDVTEQKQKELEKELLGKISLNFSFENDLLDAAIALCQTLNDYGHFDFVELWLPSLDNKHIQLFAHVPASSKADTFYELSKHIKSFAKGEGLPGIVWGKNTSLLWDDISKKDDFVRKEAAQKAGIASAMGIPLEFNEKIVGVLVVGTQRELQHLKKYKALFEHLRQFIGSEINRKKLENDLEHLYDAIPDIICITDLEGRFLKINKAGCDLIGHSVEEILYNTFEKFVHPDDKESSHHDLEKLKKGEKTVDFENRYINKNGDIVWLSWTSNSNLQEGLIYATASNITEEKRLRELNRQASKLARIGSWEIDVAGNKLYWSDTVHELHETNPESFEPDLETAINFYREDFRERVNEEVTKCIETGTGFDFEAVIITANKQERWVRAIGNAEMVNGKCQRIYGSFQDIHERKIAELQKISLQNTLGNSLNEIYIFDSETLLFSYMNKGALHNLGYSEHEIKALTPLDLKPEFTASSFRQLVAPLLDNENEKIVFSTNHKRKDGSLYPVEVHLQFVADGSNKRFVAIILDITERKKAEEELQRAYEEKNKILESIGDAFFTVDKNWIITYWNREAENLVGRKREDLIGDNLWDLFPDAIDSDFYRAYHKAMETGEKTIVEDYYPAVNKWFEVTVYPSDEGLSVYFKDITLRKEADIRLLEANKRFEKVTEATNDAIWDWNILEDTLYWGEGYKKLFGYEVDKITLTMEFYFQHIHPDDRDWVVQSIHETIEKPDQTDWMAEYRYEKSDGTFADVVDRGVVIRDDNGKPTRMVGAMNDITERKNFEQQLIELNKSLKEHAHELELTNEQLEQFAFIASHDLQEPLRMVSSFMDQLKRKYEDQLDEKALQYIHFARDGAKRMKQIILDLLEYSRAGELTDSPEEINMNNVLDDYQLLRRKIIAEKSVEINIDKLPVIHSYKAPLTQTLHSLIDNAINYSREGVPPRIDISAEERDDDWMFRIRDNGIGIDPKFFEKIFIIFQRLHNRDQYKGTGIGLSIAKKHVESWGGEIWLESTPGEGTTFYFTVPKTNE